jgi:hypothetical protein
MGHLPFHATDISPFRALILLVLAVIPRGDMAEDPQISSGRITYKAVVAALQPVLQ